MQRFIVALAGTGAFLLIGTTAGLVLSARAVSYFPSCGAAIHAGAQDPPGGGPPPGVPPKGRPGCVVLFCSCDNRTPLTCVDVVCAADPTGKCVCNVALGSCPAPGNTCRDGTGASFHCSDPIPVGPIGVLGVMMGFFIIGLGWSRN